MSTTNKYRGGYALRIPDPEPKPTANSYRSGRVMVCPKGRPKQIDMPSPLRVEPVGASPNHHRHRHAEFRKAQRAKENEE